MRELARPPVSSRSSLFRFIAVLLTVAQAGAVALGVGHAHVRCTAAAVEESRHAELAPTAGDHGHTHDDGEDDERIPGHVHGKNVVDHTHETPSVVFAFGVPAPAPYRSWTPGAERTAQARPPDTIDRPPKRA